MISIFCYEDHHIKCKNSKAKTGYDTSYCRCECHPRKVRKTKEKTNENNNLSKN